MLKRVIVGLDTSPHSRAALRFACEHAAPQEGHIVGLGLVHRAVIPVPPAAAFMGVTPPPNVPTPQTKEEIRARMDSVEQEFRGMCEYYGVSHSFERHDGPPALGLMRQGARADLIVLGTRTFFTTPQRADNADIIRTVTGSGLCPVVLMPAGQEVPKRYLLATDGSPHATRAMRLFNYQIPPRDTRTEITVLNVNDDEAEGQRITAAARSYLEAHGHDVFTAVRDGKPHDTIPAFAKTFPPALVVIGASTRSELSKLLFGSVTEHLIHDGECALYLAT